MMKGIEAHDQREGPKPEHRVPHLYMYFPTLTTGRPVSAELPCPAAVSCLYSNWDNAHPTFPFCCIFYLNH